MASKGLVATTPFGARDDAIVISIHPLKPSVIRLSRSGSNTEYSKKNHHHARQTDEL
jgi:hypothetical protein